jgi:DNA-binding transcriptional ArsR family regulator
MEMSSAIAALSALAQDGRLAVFRLLVERGEDGMPAGEVARAHGVPANTMSARLDVLAGAGLVRARRDGRSIIYSVDFATVRDLLAFLMQDCCNGRPEACEPLLAAALPGCCGPAPSNPAPRRAPTRA